MRTKFLLMTLCLFAVSCKLNEEQVSRKAERIHDNILSVDTHCDTPMRLLRGSFDLGARNDRSCVDFPKMKEGRLDAEFFAIFIGQGPRTPEDYEREHGRTLEVFDSIKASVARNQDIAGIALNPDDALRLKNEGKVAVFIGIENGYPIGTDITRIGQYYDLGARYITLCHSSNNDICDSSSDKGGPEHNGLSAFGEEVVREMNRVGMMVDVSHISDESFYDVLAVTKAPVIASHSSCRALCENPRNLNDDMLQALKKNGGVIQICILSDYLRQPVPNPEYDAKVRELRESWRSMGELTMEQQEKRWEEFSKLKAQYVKLATIEDAVNHIQHVIDVIGIDHVGIGTDFDGGGSIEGCTDASMMKNITKEMIRRGYSRDDIARIWGGNIMRVMREVQAAASREQSVTN
ncbi:MAG TPA: dipeptidase [Bacteroidales bacterium]|jgi:membrane dipeptidase|nr:dipeptidase [Bacteroidales bacterium]MDI9533092.1 dipeptidase [Bacteroidota bacterium]OPZ57977.1 MAG: Membrane dipeptidase (Peptidase family M19) [Bacteroidetes bacterium ADurb.BinA012]MBK7733020.1 dipeptidase [Bacteroidales bacterium]MBP7035725.1 dipeptidase [Bacteroidales bacterium]